MATNVNEQTSVLTHDTALPVEAPLDPDAVAIRAYEIYCSRGCGHGHDLDDWVEAERQLREAPANGSQDF